MKVFAMLVMCSVAAMLASPLLALQNGAGQGEDAHRPDGGARDFESFAARRGVLQVREEYRLSAIEDEKGVFTPTVVRVTAADTGTSAVALEVAYGSPGSLDLDKAHILDPAELVDLAAALERMRETRERVVEQAETSTQLSYGTSSGLRVGFFIMPDKTTSDYIVVGEEQRFIRSLESLEQVVHDALERIRDLNQQPYTGLADAPPRADQSSGD